MNGLGVASRSLCLGVGVLVALAAEAAAEGSPERPLVVVVESGHAHRTIDPRAVRQAISHELDMRVVSLAERRRRETRGVLSVEIHANGAVVVAYRDPEGRGLWRSTTAGADHDAVIDTVALLAGNLVRNEADPLLAQLHPPSPHGPKTSSAADPSTNERRRSLAKQSVRPLDTEADVRKMTRLTIASSTVVGDVSPQRPTLAPWALSVALGPSFGDLLMGRGEVAFSRRWPHFGLGALFSTAHGRGQLGSNDESVNHGLHVLAVTTDLRLGPSHFGVELGSAVGMAIYSFRSDFNYSGIVPYGALRANVAVEVTSGFDVTAGGHVASTFRSLDAGGKVQAVSPLRGGLSLGVRGRFP
jgi:hypothetical protein